MAGYPFRPTRSSRAVLNYRTCLVFDQGAIVPRPPGVIARSVSDEDSRLLARPSGLLRGACHRARVRATRWLAMTEKASRFHQSRARPACDRILVAMRQRQIGFRTH